MALTTAPVIDKQIWEEFIASHPEANFLHAWAWAEANTALGKETIRLGVWRGKTLLGAAIAVIEPARRGRYLAVAGGPILDWQQPDVVATCIEGLRAIAQTHSCVFVRVRPQLVSSPASQQLFQELGFRPAQMHLEAELTSQLSIEEDENTLRDNFRKNTRYEIKQAKKKGVVVSSSDNPEDVRKFYELQLATAKRHGFVPFSYQRLQTEFEAFAKDGNVLLYSAHSKEGALIAQAFIIFYNEEASYHYGASTELGRELPGAYAIQWKAILEAKRRGCSRYNFWGVVRPDETKHRFYGVSVFKRGFRGEDVEYLHAHDLVLKPLPYMKNFIVEFVRKRIRNV